jgi:hypothetical protein
MYQNSTKAYTYPLDNKIVCNYQQQGQTQPITTPKPPKKLGQGGYGQVFEANNENHVVKQVDKYNPCDRFVKAFDLTSITEMVVLKKQTFTNIPKLHSITSNNNKLMIEMDNRGSTLYAFSKKLTFEQRCSLLPWIAYQLMRTSLQLQSNGIVHNDIKSANVLINDNLIVSLIDFGLCVFETVDDTKQDVSISKNWGTYCICPPEMFIDGKWIVDKIMPWSIGITLCEFLFSTQHFLKDFVFDEKEKKLYSIYIRYGHMLKSLISTAFCNRILLGETCILLQEKTIPINIIDMISKMLMFNPSKRLTLSASLQSPLLNQFVKSYNTAVICNIVPEIYYHAVGEALAIANHVDNSMYIEYRKCCIEWIYTTYANCKRLFVLPHAISIFDRFLSRMNVTYKDYVIVACAAMYIAQYIHKVDAIRLVSIVDSSYLIVRKLERSKLDYNEVKLYIELVLSVLDYDLYYRTFDALLANENIAVSHDKVCNVMINTLPPYNNMILVKNYRKLLSSGHV